MQFRHLRYFVKIVEAGSFSRAATTIHVAQPALSQQIQELEERLGVLLLQRSARGVRPTPAGEILFREASAILRQLEALPGIVRSSSGELEGGVSLGIASSLAPKIIGGLIERCRDTLPKVMIKIADGDSETLENRVRASECDLALVYEDEFVPAFVRRPLFRQRMYLISARPVPGHKTSISLQNLAKMPLVLPSPPNARRVLINRFFTELNIKPTIVAEADTVAAELTTVRNGVGSTILPTGDMSNWSPDAFTRPLLIEPAMHLTCSIISSSDFPLTAAGEAVLKTLFAFVEGYVNDVNRLGVDWIGKNI